MITIKLVVVIILVVLYNNCNELKYERSTYSVWVQMIRLGSPGLKYNTRLSSDESPLDE